MTKTRSTLVAAPLLVAMAALAPISAGAVDAASAQAVMKENKCSKCHAADKDKSGPSLKKIAAKYKGKADAEQSVTKAMTAGPKVKAEDGTEEAHPIVKTKDAAALKNLALWILSN